MQQGEVLIRAEGVSKKFCRNLKRSLWYGLTDISKRIFGASPSAALRKDEFWAVRDVSFEVRRGECLGLIGHNGAGKSTLLKMLNGLIRPDEGKIEMHGRVGALIELGAGFNPLLTGRENVYNNGAVLGFTKNEIDSKFKAIVEFAELEEFIDMPVQNYSSGMKVRLGFAVASQMEPDILLIDEVLAVGDIGFRIKCLNRINQLSSNTAFIFVSHSMADVAKISSSLLLLNRTGVKYYGSDLGKGIEYYFDEFDAEESICIGTDVQLNSIKILYSADSNDSKIPVLEYLQDLNLEVDFVLNKDLDQIEIDLGFLDKELKQIGVYTSGSFRITKRHTKVLISMPNIPFAFGDYSINLAFFEVNGNSITSYNKVLTLFKSIQKFRVRGSTLSRHAAIQLSGTIKQYD